MTFNIKASTHQNQNKCTKYTINKIKWQPDWERIFIIKADLQPECTGKVRAIFEIIQHRLWLIAIALSFPKSASLSLSSPFWSSQTSA